MNQDYLLNFFKQNIDIGQVNIATPPIVSRTTKHETVSVVVHSNCPNFFFV